MGRSPSIQDLAQKEQEFRNYLNTLEQDLDTRSAKVKQGMQASIDSFYNMNGYDDAKQMVSGQNTDFMHEAEFSMANLKNIIDQLSAAVFSGGEVPQGADVNRESVQEAGTALGPAVGAMSNLELFIAGKVFDVLSSVVLSFGTSTQITYTSTSETKSLAYGIEMFTAVAASSYESTSFFNNEYINQYIFMYDVRFSVKQSKVEQQLGLVQLYTNELTAYEEKINDLLNQLIAGTISADAFKSAKDIYNELIQEVQVQINNLKSATAYLPNS